MSYSKNIREDAVELRIFLASSINEFRIDRLAIGDFILRLNQIYNRAKDSDKNIRFVLEKCEYYDEYIAIDGKQSEYDEIIPQCNIMCLLFGKTIGDYTKHEFDIAYKSFEKYNFAENFNIYQNSHRQ